MHQFTSVDDAKAKIEAWRVDYSVQGNILVGPEVIEAMAAAFEKTQGALADNGCSPR